ncbi:hypothetical protein BpHYR1_005578 [Brachionus plicatilis]|uniref:Uncharacterized protein n=1 Tax=Brachionus plicatilis TaxID=10195 RepID=A0A3M7SME5_BRAPC|nr:hypothetical protein BpHYR1_005578 [Brachionus plicatilis]
MLPKPEKTAYYKGKDPSLVLTESDKIKNSYSISMFNKRFCDSSFDSELNKDQNFSYYSQFLFQVRVIHFLEIDRYIINILKKLNCVNLDDSKFRDPKVKM